MKAVSRVFGKIVLALTGTCLVLGAVFYFFWWNRAKADYVMPPIAWFKGEAVAHFTVTSWKEGGKEKSTARVDIEFKKPGTYLLENWSESDGGGTLLGDLSIEVSEKEVPKHVQQDNLGGRLEVFRMVKAQGGRRGKSGALEKADSVIQPTPGVNIQYLIMGKPVG